LLAALAGCGSASPSTTTHAGATHAQVTRARAKRPPPHRRHRRPSGPRVGARLRVHAGAATLEVTVARVIDPLRGSGAAVPPGEHVVGVLVRILNRGPGVYDSSATGDFSLHSSAGDASPTFVPRGICQTPLRDFDNEISPGEERSGCVAFGLPAGARALTVRFSPHGSPTGRVAWKVG
jgi:hypothetical protein